MGTGFKAGLLGGRLSPAHRVRPLLAWSDAAPAGSKRVFDDVRGGLTRISAGPGLITTYGQSGTTPPFNFELAL
jgi:hypothetical protein